MKDKEGGIWALTNQAGAVHIIPKNKIFNQHIIPNNPIVNTFYEDNLHRIIWIGTQKGLFKYNIDSKEIQEYNLAEKEKTNLRYTNSLPERKRTLDRNVLERSESA